MVDILGRVTANILTWGSLFVECLAQKVSQT